jgi:hypothetical protein
VEGRAVPVITGPVDGSTVYSAYYPIFGNSARPGAPVELRSLENPWPDDMPQDTVKARSDGTFIFAGTTPAAANEQWVVTSAGQVSAPVSVVTAEPQPIVFTATPADLVVTLTITSAIEGEASVDFGDDTGPVAIAANTATLHAYGVADTYTITVSPPEGAAGLPWTAATTDVTVTEPAEELESQPEPEPEPEPTPQPELPAEGSDTVEGGAA